MLARNILSRSSLLLLAVLFGTQAAQGDVCPACTDATPVKVGTTAFIGAPTGCTITPQPGNCELPSNNTSFFSFTPSESRSYRIKVVTDEIDRTLTVLKLWADCGVLSELACTFGLPEGTLLANVQLEEGIEYRISIGADCCGAEFIESGVLSIEPVDPPGFGCSSATQAVLGVNAFDNSDRNEVVDLAPFCNPVPSVGDGKIYNAQYFRFTPASTGVYTISTCDQDSTAWERLAVLRGCTPGAGIEACSDAECFRGDDTRGSSILGVALTAGVEYTILVGGVTGLDAGPGRFVISPLQTCPAPPTTRNEIEPCGQESNGICIMEPQNAEPIQIGESVRGSYWALDDVRDSDIYRFEVAQGTRVHFELNAVIPGVALFVTPQCQLDPFASQTTGFCPSLSEGECLAPGVYFVIVLPLFSDRFPCDYDGGNGYTLTLRGEPCDASPPPNDACADAKVVFEGTTESDNFFAASESSEATCTEIGRDVWFSFAAPETFAYKFSICSGSLFDTGIDVWTGCPGDGGVLIGCNADANQLNCLPELSAVVVELTAGQVVRVRVGSERLAGAFQTGSFELSIVRVASGLVCGDPKAGDCCVPSSSPYCNDITCCNLVCSVDPSCCADAWDRSCAALAVFCPGPCGGIPANDDCKAAIDATAGLNPFKNVSAEGSTATDCGAINSDVWFSYTAATDEPVTISLCEKDGGWALIAGGASGDLDVRIAVFEACGGSPIACNDDACGVRSRLTFTPTCGETYLIAIGSRNADEGAFGQGVGAFRLIEGSPCGGGTCVADLNGDGQVGAQDLAALLSAWDAAAGDLNGDGTTNAQDLAALLGAWGPCGP